MPRIIRLLVFGAVFGAVAGAVAIGFAHGVILKSGDWKDRAGYGFVVGALCGAIGALSTLIERRR
jgi:hypothetical protein